MTKVAPRQGVTSFRPDAPFDAGLPPPDAAIAVYVAGSVRCQAGTVSVKNIRRKGNSTVPSAPAG